MQIYTSHSRCTLCFSKKKFPWNKLRTACVAYFAVCFFVVVVVFNEIRKLSGSIYRLYNYFFFSRILS